MVACSIGLAIATRLGSEGAKVVVSSRKEENVRKTVDDLLAQGMEASGIVCHVGKAEHRAALVSHAIAEYGGLDILVSNAAVNPFYGPTMEVGCSCLWRSSPRIDPFVPTLLTALN